MVGVGQEKKKKKMNPRLKVLIMTSPICPPSYLQLYPSPLLCFSLQHYLFHAKRAPKSRKNHNVRKGGGFVRDSGVEERNKLHLEEEFRLATPPTEYPG